MREADQIRPRHMLDAAREAVLFAEGKSREDLDGDRMLALALMKCIEIVGEAAANLSTASRDTLPTVPWQSILGMRNRLVHAYLRDRRGRCLVYNYSLASPVDPNFGKDNHTCVTSGVIGGH